MIKDIHVGRIDVMSSAAFIHRVPLCTSINPETGAPCTRAAGHDETIGKHPGVAHVATWSNFAVREIWGDTVEQIEEAAS